MFGFGPTEIVVIFLLVLMLFGPSKLPQMARDFGRFVTEARRAVDEFKDELTSSVEEEEESRPRSKKKVTARKKTDRDRRVDDAEKDGFLSKKEEEHDF